MTRSGQWRSSDRRSRLPKDWDKIRKRILKRDGYRCTEILDGGQRCPEVANQCDHVVPGDDHSDSNLTSLCGPHHAAKSAREGVAARQALANARRRAPMAHPADLR